MNSFVHVSLNQNPPGCRNADVPHAHEYHEMLYCIDGQGGQLAGHREFSLGRGDLFFYPIGMRHCSVFLPGHQFTCFVLGFQESMFTPALAGDKEILDVVEKMGKFSGKVPLSTKKEEVEPILRTLLDEFQRKESPYEAILKMTAMRLFATIARDKDFQSQGIRVCPSPSNQNLIQEVVAYIEAFYMNEITVEAVLDFCPMSRSHFHAVFKEITGKTFLTYIKEVRLEKAKELLTTTDAPVAEVAFHTGFHSSSYMGQIFRAATGMSPGQYRKQSR